MIKICNFKKQKAQLYKPRNMISIFNLQIQVFADFVSNLLTQKKKYIRACVLLVYIYSLYQFIFPILDSLYKNGIFIYIVPWFHLTELSSLPKMLQLRVYHTVISKYISRVPSRNKFIFSLGKHRRLFKNFLFSETHVIEIS